VNTAGDPGPGGTLSLRQAVALASQNPDPSNTILFEDGLIGSTISLAQGAIAVEQPMFIVGFANRGSLTISGADVSRVFEVKDAQSVTLKDVTLTHGDDDGCGGAVYGKGNQTLTLDNVAVTQSSAFFGGGVCAVSQSTLVLLGSRISGNDAAFGGGLYVGQSAYYLGASRTTISANTARRAGGGVYLGNVERSAIVFSLIAGNSVPAPAEYFYSAQGGGLVAAGIGSKGLRIVATTITGNNSYAAGSALRIMDPLSGDRTKLINATVAGNSSGTGGSAISAEGTPLLLSAIVADNGGGDLAGAFTSNYSLIRNPGGAQISGNHNVLGADPLLGPLADHGGPTLCMLPAPGSPVVGAGHVVAEFGDAQLDQRLYSFVGTRDIGAVERQEPEDIVFRSAFESW
jgi:hypothetical protein